MKPTTLRRHKQKNTSSKWMYSGQFLKRLDSADGFGAQRHWRRGIGNLQLLTVHHRVFIRY